MSVKHALVICSGFLIVIIFLSAFFVESFFNWYASPLRKRLKVEVPDSLPRKLARLGIGMIIDSISVFIFITATILFFYLYTDQSYGLRLLLATYLAAIVIVRLTFMLSRFFLAPKDSELRILPMGTSMANYLHLWMAVISIISSFGIFFVFILLIASTNSMILGTYGNYSAIKTLAMIPSLRIALAATFVVWTLNIWGLEFSIGKAVVRASFNILVVILSAMGVNIGPMIAGAGVFGLAIGFGAQTLVKDIISGIFFLMDDAFRVGDYIAVGGTKGMVEQMSKKFEKLLKRKSIRLF